MLNPAHRPSLQGRALALGQTRAALDQHQLVSDAERRQPLTDPPRKTTRARACLGDTKVCRLPQLEPRGMRLSRDCLGKGRMRLGRGGKVTALADARPARVKPRLGVEQCGLHVLRERQWPLGANALDQPLSERTHARRSSSRVRHVGPPSPLSETSPPW